MEQLAVEKQEEISPIVQSLMLEAFRNLATRYKASFTNQDDLKQLVTNIQSAISNSFTAAISNEGYEGVASIEEGHQYSKIKPQFYSYKIKLTPKLAKYYATVLYLLSYLRQPKVLFQIAASLPDNIDYGNLGVKARTKYYNCIETNKTYFQDFLLARFMRPTHSAIVTVPKQNYYYGLRIDELYNQEFQINDYGVGSKVFENTVLPKALFSHYPMAGVTTPQATMYHKMLVNILSAMLPERKTYLGNIKKFLAAQNTTAIFSQPKVNLLENNFNNDSKIAFMYKRTLKACVPVIQYMNLDVSAASVSLNSAFFQPNSTNICRVLSGPTIYVANNSSPNYHTIVSSSVPSLLDKFELASNNINLLPLATLQYSVENFRKVDSRVLLQESITDLAALLPEYIGFILWFISGLDINNNKNKPLFSSLETDENKEMITALGNSSDRYTNNHGEVVSQSIIVDPLINTRLLFSDLAIAPILDSFLNILPEHDALTLNLEYNISNANAYHSIFNGENCGEMLIHNISDTKVKHNKRVNRANTNIENYYDALALSPVHFIYSLCGFPGVLEIGANNYFEDIAPPNYEPKLNSRCFASPIVPTGSLRGNYHDQKDTYLNVFRNMYDLNVIEPGLSSWYKGKTSCYHGYESLLKDNELAKCLSSDLKFNGKNMKRVIMAYDKQSININTYSFRRYQDYINSTIGFTAGMSHLGMHTPWPLDIDYQYGAVSVGMFSPSCLFAGGMPKTIAEYLKRLYAGEIQDSLFKAPDLPGSQGPEPFVTSYLQDDIEDSTTGNNFFADLYTGKLDSEDFGLPDNIVLSDADKYIDIISQKLLERCSIKITAHDPIYTILYNIANNDDYLEDLYKTFRSENSSINVSMDLVVTNLLANILGNFERPTLPFTIAGVVESLWAEGSTKKSIPDLMRGSLSSILGGISLPLTSANIIRRKINTLDTFIKYYDAATRVSMPNEIAVSGSSQSSREEE